MGVLIPDEAENVIMEIQVIDPVFKNFAIINVILGGFGLVFIAALLLTKRDSIFVNRIASTAFIASACFFISAIFSTGAITYSFLHNISNTHYSEEIPEAISTIFYYPSVSLFFIGFLFFSICIGLCGWLFSKKVGIVSSITAVALFITSAVMAIITFFIL